jgi:copper homeostasis protein (lipoprotein)
MNLKAINYLSLIVISFLFSCNDSSVKKSPYVIYKGVYSFGPEVKSFKDCDSGEEFWVTDNSRQLELKYSQLNFEKPYEPVYVEVEAIKVRSGKDGLGSEYDSTLVVKRLIKISKEIPLDMCN